MPFMRKRDSRDRQVALGNLDLLFSSNHDKLLETTDSIISRYWPPSRSFIQAVGRGFILISQDLSFAENGTGPANLARPGSP